MILHVTAKHNSGLCGRCGITESADRHEREQAEQRRNAPPSSINYNAFSKRQFVAGLRKCCAPLVDDPEQVSAEFLGFCDPIVHRPLPIPILSVIFFRHSLFLNFRRIPRPYRELLAVYHAWGMVCSDGFESYVMNTNKFFDREVERGLSLLGQTQASGAVAAAREALKLDPDEQLPKDIDDNLWHQFYDSMAEFESAILGKRLIQLLKLTP